ncbi:hypothetical protein ABH926_002086 [Catenulispora sp. GP43]|uniref:hypothetical protein n=1 Tax=Catenulispora sp. GP43 TaxID=3156263 RepID=UPI003513D7CC
MATSLGVALVSVVAAWGPTFADRREQSGEETHTGRRSAESSGPISAAFGPVPAGPGPVAQVAGAPRSRQVVGTGDRPTVTVGGPTWMFVAVAGLAFALAAAASAADLVDRTGHTDRTSAGQPGTGTAAAAGPAAATIETSVLGMNISGADYCWPGTESALNTSLENGTPLTQEPGLERIYAQSAVTVTIQTESLDQILISGFRVVDVQRSSAPKAGVLVYLPCGGCGGEQPVRKFTVDLDASAPQIVASPSPSSGDYYCVSAGSSEEFYVALTDHAACTFDFEIDWVAAGKQHSTIVDNGGQPFRVLGLVPEAADS